MGDISDLYGGGAVPTGEMVPADNFDPLPPGWYSALIDSAEVKETKAGTGNYLNIQFNILDEGFSGRKVFSMIHLKNPNEKCVEIGMAQLAALSRSIGVLSLSDSAELCNKPMMIKLKIQQQEGYEPQNSVTGYKAIGGGAASPGIQRQGDPAQVKNPVASVSPALPWLKKK